MTGSAAEREIRDAVVAHWRQLWPGWRIVHELNVDGQGSNRVDLTAIGPNTLVMCEVKSERDVIDRLGDQMHAFGPRCHALIVTAHEVWFESPGKISKTRRRKGSRLVRKEDGDPGWEHDVWIAEQHTFNAASPIEAELRRFPHWRVGEWRYPRPDGYRAWNITKYEWSRPWPWLLLTMLWREELLAECARHHIAAGPRTTRTDMMTSMLELMRGPEIERAVCRQLRRRQFAEADPPLIDEVENA